MADPISLQILANRLRAVTAEMTAVYRRGAESAARSGFADFAMGLVDLTNGGRLVAADVHHPAHLVPLKTQTLEGLAVFASGGLNDGDTVLINDPYKRGGALPDITFATLVYEREAPRWAAVGRARFTDVGGAGLSGVYPLAWEVYQEGDIIPGVQVARDGVVFPDVLRRLTANSRTPRIYESDIKAIIAATRHSRARIQALAEQCGPALLEAASSLAIERGSWAMRAALESIPPGSYRGSARLDSDYNRAENVEIAVTLEAGPEGVHLDFTGASPKVIGPFNSPEANTASFALLPLLSLLPEGAALNEGILQRVRCTLPEGSIVNPADPACTSLCTWYTGPRIAEAVADAVNKAAPGLVQQSFPVDPYVVLGGVEGKRGNAYAINRSWAGRPQASPPTAIHRPPSSERKLPLSKSWRARLDCPWSPASLSPTPAARAGSAADRPSGRSSGCPPIGCSCRPLAKEASTRRPAPTEASLAWGMPSSSRRAPRRNASWAPARSPTGL